MADEAGGLAESRTWDIIPSIQVVVDNGSFMSANNVFTELKRTVLAASQEELDEQSMYAELIWSFLVGFATEKSQYKSIISQVAKRLLEVPQWHAVFNSMVVMQNKVKMLHPDLQLAFGFKIEKRPAARKAPEHILDRNHCCLCNNCAKPWAFQCKFKSPHYCVQHYQKVQRAGCEKDGEEKDLLFTWSEVAPQGFQNEVLPSDTHVSLRKTLPVQTQRLVASATSQAKFQQELSEHKVTIAPDKVDRNMVDRAQKLVHQMREAIRKDQKEHVANLSGELQKLIPQDSFTEISTEEDLLKQIEILQLLDSLIDCNELKTHDALAKYCSITFLEPDTEEGRLVRGMLMQNLGGDVDITHMDAFRVARHEEEERERSWANIHPSNNRVLLWHGSQNTRFVSILKNGLKLKDDQDQWLIPGGTFDTGLYFTDVVSKSLQYCGGSSKECLLILAEVCLGSMYCVKGRFGLCFDWNARRRAQQLGCHSTWGLGRTWPDPSTAMLGTPDSMVPCCDIPLGQPVNVRSSDGQHPALDYNEFIVYNSEQVRIKYLLRLRYEDAAAGSPGSVASFARSAAQRHADAPCIMMPPIEGNVLQIPYCRFARDAVSSKLESTYRWQYYFDKKQMFDSTLPGWHSFNMQEAKSMERSFREDTQSVKIRNQNGYEYDMDFAQMTQSNLSTGKIRPIRRVEVAFKRVTVPASKSLKLSMDLEKGESTSWIFEVEGEQRIDFKVELCPEAANEDVLTVINATRSAHAWSFAAPARGKIQLQWRNSFPFASERVVLYDWHKEAAVVKDGQQFGGPRESFGSATEHQTNLEDHPGTSLPAEAVSSSQSSCNRDDSVAKTNKKRSGEFQPPSRQ